MRILKTVLVLGTALVAVSCNRTAAVPLHPVRGAVLYKEKPAVGARVVLHPVGTAGPDRPLPQATVEADGSFRLSSYTRHDGAPAGRYVVTVVWPSDGARDEDGTPAGPDRLKGRYADPKKSPLRVNVGPDENELHPFRLP